MKGYTSVIPSAQSRVSPRQVLQIGSSEPVLTIEDVKDIQKQSDTRLALLQDQLEKTQEQQGMITAYGGILGSQLSQLQTQQRIREGGMSQRVEPFANVKGSGDSVPTIVVDDYEIDEGDFSNQGTQNIPESIMKVDLSPMPTEILEDDEDVGDEPIIVPEKQGGGAVAFAEPEPVIEEKKKKEIQLIDPFKDKMIEVTAYHQIPQKPSNNKPKATYQAYLNTLKDLGYPIDLNQTIPELKTQIDNIIELEYTKLKDLEKKKLEKKNKKKKSSNV
jgi:hypothetical protein